MATGDEPACLYGEIGIAQGQRQTDHDDTREPERMHGQKIAAIGTPLGRKQRELGGFEEIFPPDQSVDLRADPQKIHCQPAVKVRSDRN